MLGGFEPSMRASTLFTASLKLLRNEEARCSLDRTACNECKVSLIELMLKYSGNKSVTEQSRLADAAILQEVSQNQLMANISASK